MASQRNIFQGLELRPQIVWNQKSERLSMRTASLFEELQVLIAIFAFCNVQICFFCPMTPIPFQDRVQVAIQAKQRRDAAEREESKRFSELYPIRWPTEVHIPSSPPSPSLKAPCIENESGPKAADVNQEARAFTNLERKQTIIPAKTIRSDLKKRAHVSPRLIPIRAECFKQRSTNVFKGWRSAHQTREPCKTVILRQTRARAVRSSPAHPWHSERPGPTSSSARSSSLCSTPPCRSGATTMMAVVGGASCGSACRKPPRHISDLGPSV